MSPSSAPVAKRQRQSRPPRKSRERNWPSKQASTKPSRRPVIRYAVIATATWLAATTVYYFAFQHDIVTRLPDEHAELQLTYEDRIADLRSRLDRIMS